MNSPHARRHQQALLAGDIIRGKYRLVPTGGLQRAAPAGGLNIGHPLQQRIRRVSGYSSIGGKDPLQTEQIQELNSKGFRDRHSQVA